MLQDVQRRTANRRVETVETEQQAGGAAGAGGTRHRAGPTLAGIAAVADQRGAATGPALTPGYYAKPALPAGAADAEHDAGLAAGPADPAVVS
ncbi:hypothetical protein MSHI_04050 [Mycobacterium shinjukuense]|uniref:Uncharacterized protein n=1 Tax=Mycobacterium shinjukuense TaxID=398694 RepID=A0A7I7MME7_9MYCO|nr:hypothetical protein MSHI_04050 [Mycobacterium shinjukuense]